MNLKTKMISVFILPFLFLNCKTMTNVAQTSANIPLFFGYETYWQLFCGCPVEGVETRRISDYLDRVYNDIKEDFNEDDRILEELENSFRAQGFQMEREVDEDGNTIGLRAAIDGDMSFATGSAELTPAAIEIADMFGDAMMANPQTVARIHGHTDSTGSYRLNRQLSQARAESVRDSMIDRQGVQPSRIIETRGFADDRKIIDTMESEPRNRRTEVLISFADEEPEE